ncbi:UDP-N-acetylmuramoyl-L-alanine--D-glutamate ligase [Virgibacillus alimentarius]|uniref:UDP-N-acetylmuramoylalanine--D-glutamate ligase n=1 Tax=Virgibacillus alimentarius TaxID=698769 RepID=A0ABS4S3P9_9BACI|nr:MULTISPECIES: UDP-N-acetylmuramoyl-L-alanine--D-glutamate ligase [Virgibacillus]MBP2256113.1 UDP-N-acetylmuramoylalanine--D-glutamate ligase [Virgibacillus alimentarius]HLR66060.1 UDP-N-acetylmuramoyl-L-alanine--D-glutamate ligase [Virgibacillus sp.]
MRKLKDFHYSHVLILGLAKSGTAAAKYLIKNNINVRVNDMNAKENDVSVTELKTMGAEVIIGSHPISVLEGIELIVKNPGITYDNPILVEAQKRNVPIITEIEIAGKLVPDSIIGITGSNGKTTTTTLITQMLTESNVRTRVAGNIGTVASDVAQELAEDEKLVLELSSFQLLGVKTFKPRVAVLLNIYEAHLDYHKTLKNYQQAKCNIFANQTSDDFLVYNADDPTVSNAIKRANSQTIPFSVKHRLVDGVWTDNSTIYFKDEKIIDKKDIVLVGSHNLENILAAVCASKLCGATNEGIYKVLSTFSGVKHRLQFVANKDKRMFYNDSKATNILATQKALSSFSKPTILLAGGLDRGNGFEELLPYLKNVKAMIVFGQTAEKLKQLAETAGSKAIEIKGNLTEAVQTAYDLSEEGDVILLSPACASWDQYRTFEERGDMFIHAVHTLM